jgi:hypothetical protein
VAFATIGGQPAIIPPWPMDLTYHVPGNNVTLGPIDATGEKMAMVGQIWQKDWTSGTKAIRKIGFLPSAVTSAGGSGLTVSLQSVSASGPPVQPDETQDETVAVLLSALTANTQFTTGALSADRTVSPGELVAVVLEFDGSGRLGADTLTLRMTTSQSNHMPACVLKTGGSWAIQSGQPNVFFEFSDGTFGTFLGALPLSGAITTFTAYASTGTPDERGLKLSLPFPYRIVGIFHVTPTNANNSDYQIRVENGAATLLGSLSIDANQVPANASRPDVRHLAPATAASLDIAANTDTYVSLRATAAGTLGVYYIDHGAAGHRALTVGTNIAGVSRSDAGAWTESTTQIPMIGVMVEALSDGAGGGGGGGPLIGGRLIR